MQRLLSFASRVDVRPGGKQFYVAALVLMLLAYAAAITMTLALPFGRAMLIAVVPVTGVILMGMPARATMLHKLFGLPAAIQATVHIVAGFTFAVLLYWLRMVLNGMLLSGDMMNVRLPDFFAPGAAWMVIEGMLLYALIALTAYIETLRGRLSAIAGGPGAATAEAEVFRLFVRQDDEFRPIDPARIVLVRGADDYAEVITCAGTHLVRMTLATLSERLGPRFIRAHRSCLVNVERITKAEPAGGGRMLLHMENGEMVSSSRSGARQLRKRIV